MNDQSLEPSNAEQAEWSEATRAYVRWLLDEIARIEGERDRQYDYNAEKIAEGTKRIDLGAHFYDIVKRQHEQLVHAGFTSQHAYAQGVLKSIMNKMDKARNDAAGNRTTRQILDDFYDASRKEWHAEQENHLKKTDENIP